METSSASTRACAPDVRRKEQRAGCEHAWRAACRVAWHAAPGNLCSSVPVVGYRYDGGSAKSTLVRELRRRGYVADDAGSDAGVPVQPARPTACAWVATFAARPVSCRTTR